MLDRHAVQALLRAGQTPRQIAHQLGTSAAPCNAHSPGRREPSGEKMQRHRTMAPLNLMVTGAGHRPPSAVLLRPGCPPTTTYGASRKYLMTLGGDATPMLLYAIK